MAETGLFAELLVEHCRRCEVSATALSKRAGLGVNTVRHLQRGLRHPQPVTVMAIARALELDAPATAELRRSAGIDPDPASDPDAKRARAEAWPALTYTLVNHVLLPRLELSHTLESREKKSSVVAAALQAAADSPSILHYYSLPDTAQPRPRGLTTLLERTFAHMDAERARWLHGVAQAQADSDRHVAPSAEDAAPWDCTRFIAVGATIGLRSAAIDEYRAWRAVQTAWFHPVFAVSMFPLLYLEACRVWPFSKVFMPYARCGGPPQRELYETARGGITPRELDEILIGRRRLGLPITPTRPPCSFGDTTPHPRPGGGGIVSYGVGPVALHTVFDHLDRCEFLDRFPLIKLDGAGAAALARADSLPSWKLWRDELRSGPGAIPEGYLDGERFPYAVDDEPPAPGRPDSFAARLIGDALQARADELAEGGYWPQLAEATRAMDMRSMAPRTRLVADGTRRAAAGLIATFAKHPPAEPSPGQDGKSP